MAKIDSLEKANEILDALHEINDPYSLLVSLFHVCNAYYLDIENLFSQSTYKESFNSFRENFETHFDEVEFTGNDISLEPPPSEISSDPKLAIIYAISLLNCLDKRLYLLISKDNDDALFFEEAANNPYYYDTEYTCTFNRETYFVAPAPCELLIPSEPQDWNFNPHKFLNYHTVFPKDMDRGFEAKVFPLSNIGNLIHQNVSKAKKLRVACIAPDRDFEFESNAQMSGDFASFNFIFQKIKDESFDSAWKALFNTFESCQKNDVDLIVFPELTIDSNLLEKIKEWLREENFKPAKEDEFPNPPIKMVVAGSFHFEEKSKGYFNRCTILDYAGSTLWEQEKLMTFGFSPKWKEENHPSTKLAIKLMTKEDVEKAKEQNEFKIKEDILHGGKIQFCDTVWGRMAVPICRDYITSEAFGNASRKTKANFFTVPMMTYGFSKFQHIAVDNFAQEQGALTFFCPSEWILKWSGIESNKLKDPIIPNIQDHESPPIQGPEEIKFEGIEYDIWEVSLENCL